MYTVIPGLPRVGTRQNAVHRIVFKGGQWDAADIPGGKIIDGSLSRDSGNTGDLDTLRAGLLMGRITSGGKYAPAILGVTASAYVAGASSISVTAAQAVEIARRIGSTGSLTIVGPPTANGVLAIETITYSAVDTSTGAITITALSNSYVAGSFIGGTDGSQDPITFLPDGYGVKVTDYDNSTSLSVPFPRMPVAGVIDSSQLLPAWPSDTSLQAWIVSKLSGQGGGKFIFDHLYN